MKQRLVTLLALVGINQHLSAEQRHDLANAAMQTAPGAAAAGGARVLGLPLSDWAVMATISFVARLPRRRLTPASQPTSLG